MSWRAVVTLLLLAGALASGYAVWNQGRQDTRVDGPAARSDYVLEDFQLIALDGKGQESFTLRAPKLERDPDAETMDIATPVFLIPAREGSSSDAWEVRSRTAWVSADGNELRLRGDVVGKSAGRAGPATTMRTDELNVFPDTKRATSPRKVVITRPGSILSGRGLQLDLASKRYSFKSEVRHRYVPNAR